MPISQRFDCECKKALKNNQVVNGSIKIQTFA